MKSKGLWILLLCGLLSCQDPNFGIKNDGVIMIGDNKGSTTQSTVTNTSATISTSSTTTTTSTTTSTTTTTINIQQIRQDIYDELMEYFSTTTTTTTTSSTTTTTTTTTTTITALITTSIPRLGDYWSPSGGYMARPDETCIGIVVTDPSETYVYNVNACNDCPHLSYKGPKGIILRRKFMEDNYGQNTTLAVVFLNAANNGRIWERPNTSLPRYRDVRTSTGIEHYIWWEINRVFSEDFSGSSGTILSIPRPSEDIPFVWSRLTDTELGGGE